MQKQPFPVGGEGGVKKFEDWVLCYFGWGEGGRGGIEKQHRTVMG